MVSDPLPASAQLRKARTEIAHEGQASQGFGLMGILTGSLNRQPMDHSKGLTGGGHHIGAIHRSKVTLDQQSTTLGTFTADVFPYKLPYYEDHISSAIAEGYGL